MPLMLKISEEKKIISPQTKKKAEEKLLKEFNDINENPDIDLPYTIDYWDPPGSENIFKWRAVFIGPEGTPYDGGLFEAQILFEEDYPESPPTVYFKTRIYNCNISRYDGKVCISLINNWKETNEKSEKYVKPENKNIKEVLFAVSTLFYFQNADDPYNSDAAELYNKTDKSEFNDKVKKFIEFYATEDKFQNQEIQNKIFPEKLINK